MSMIYTNTRVVCSCDTSPVGDADAAGHRRHLFAGTAAFALHRLAELYFCRTCQCLKCRRCLNAHIEGKFCPSCMADHLAVDARHCTKNCFNCPRCSSHLVISSNSIERAKQFAFVCTYCDYTYTTAVVDRPRSLLSILRSEQRAADPQARAFEQFRAKFKAMVAYNRTVPEAAPRRLLPQVLAKLETLNLTSLTKKYATDNAALALEAASVAPLPLHEDAAPEGNIHQRCQNFPFQSLPNPNRLATKLSLSCRRCREPVEVPDPSPVLLKFATRCNAVDVAPTVQVTQTASEIMLGVPQTCILNFCNPTGGTMEIKVATLAVVPQQLCPGARVEVSLALRSIRLGPATTTKRDLVADIPTPLLTDHSQVSRAEKMRRLGSEPAPNDSFDDSFDTAIATTASWALVRLHYTVTGTGSLWLQVPLHLDVATVTPDQLVELRYWMVAELGTVSLKVQQ